MKRFLPALCALCILFVLSVPIHAQTAPGVRGILYKYYAQLGRCCYAVNFDMKWCKADANGRPTNQCTTGTTDAFGNYLIYVQHGSGNYFPYAWDDDIYWGSQDYPINGPIVLLAGTVNNVSGALEVRPRAVPPTAVYPSDGAVNVPTTIVLQWSDGLDVDRRRNDWPVTYDIWASGNEFPQIKVYENVPCGGVPGSGVCSMAVTGLVYTSRYEWRVVARMHSGPIVPQAGPDNSYYTSSATFRFSTQWDPATPYYTIAADNGRLLRAVGGGGSTVDAAGTVSSYETQFKFIDPNGGTLFSGDPVYIQTNRNYYLSAVGGGGAGVETQKWTMSYETWTIVRVAGFGPISAGDQVAFRASNGSNYLSAAGGGGSSVSAAGTAAGPFETFIFR